MTKSIRMRTRHLLASVAIGAAVLALAPIIGVWPQATAQAQYIVAAEFRIALSPYGRWQNHSRWGEVWIADPVPADWRPYTRGRWLYTDEWGWYWETAAEEANWGWVTNHYGRWVHDRELGWMWVPGEDWAPAWVDWRHGDDYVGWAPLPPDDLLVEYRDDPVYWSFVRPRFLLAPRVFTVFVPARERVVIIRRTKIVNRTVIVDRQRGERRARVAVNAGIEPGIIARASGRPIRASNVQPAVLRGTKDVVDGAREVDAKDGRRARAVVRQTDTVIKPADKAERPRELRASDKGRVGEHLSQGAQRQGAQGNESRSSNDNRTGNNRDSDQGRSPPPVNVIRGGSNEAARNASPPPPPPPVANERRGQNNVQTRNSPPPPPVARERNREQENVRVNSPPPPPVVRRPPPPPPPVLRASPPPRPAVSQRPAPEPRGGNNRQNERQNNRQQERSR